MWEGVVFILIVMTTIGQSEKVVMNAPDRSSLLGETKYRTMQGNGLLMVIRTGSHFGKVFIKGN